MNNGEFATFGGGSFWYIDAIFRKIKGVENVISGYSGGHFPSPTYKDICSGATGHALVVQIIYQPNIISYEELLQIFFASHDPTTLNAQGPDKGTHYRSIILCHNDEQQKAAEEFIIKIKDQYLNPITTDIAVFKQFYTAEPMHQNFYKFNRESGYSIFVIEPKLKFIKRLFPNIIKDIILNY